MKRQMYACKVKQCTLASKLECDFVPVISYLEWCGIKLDVDKWKVKMEVDNKNLDEAIKALNDFVVQEPKLKKFVYIEQQGEPIYFVIRPVGLKGTNVVYIRKPEQIAEELANRNIAAPQKIGLELELGAE
jgi:hypothetical protein